MAATPVAAGPAGPAVVVGFHVATGGRGRKRLRPDGAPTPAPPPAGRVPRVARMLALAHRWKGLIDDGTVADQVALARLVGVSRARVTQVMDLLRLAPDIQEAVLYLPRVERGRDPIGEVDVRRVAAQPDWRAQRRACGETAMAMARVRN